MALSFSIDNLLKATRSAEKSSNTPTSCANIERTQSDRSASPSSLHLNLPPTQHDSAENSPTLSSDVNEKENTWKPGATSTPAAGPMRRKKARTSFTDQQVAILETRYLNQRYISPGERLNLARALGLQDQQVKTWFQNRRMKEKRVCESDGGSANGPSIGHQPLPGVSLYPGVPNNPLTPLNANFNLLPDLHSAAHLAHLPGLAFPPLSLPGGHGHQLVPSSQHALHSAASVYHHAYNHAQSSLGLLHGVQEPIQTVGSMSHNLLSPTSFAHSPLMPSPPLFTPPAEAVAPSPDIFGHKSGYPMMLGQMTVH